MASAGPYESTEVRVNGAGKGTVVSGAAPQGQGIGTALAEVAADKLGVEIDQVNVFLVDTGRTPSQLGP